MNNLFTIFICFVLRNCFAIRTLYVGIYEEIILLHIVRFKQWLTGLFSLNHPESLHKNFLGTKPSGPFNELNNEMLCILILLVRSCFCLLLLPFVVPIFILNHRKIFLHTLNIPRIIFGLAQLTQNDHGTNASRVRAALKIFSTATGC